MLLTSGQSHSGQVIFPTSPGNSSGRGSSSGRSGLARTLALALFHGTEGRDLLLQEALGIGVLID